MGELKFKRLKLHCEMKNIWFDWFQQTYIINIYVGKRKTALYPYEEMTINSTKYKSEKKFQIEKNSFGAETFCL